MEASPEVNQAEAEAEATGVAAAVAAEAFRDPEVEAAVVPASVLPALPS
jgi:hypothetical protein